MSSIHIFRSFFIQYEKIFIGKGACRGCVAKGGMKEGGDWRMPAARGERVPCTGAALVGTQSPHALHVVLVAGNPRLSSQFQVLFTRLTNRP